jgi:hypothetical protein
MRKIGLLQAELSSFKLAVVHLLRVADLLSLLQVVGETLIQFFFTHIRTVIAGKSKANDACIDPWNHTIRSLYFYLNLMKIILD